MVCCDMFFQFFAGQIGTVLTGIVFCVNERNVAVLFFDCPGKVVVFRKARINGRFQRVDRVAVVKRKLDIIFVKFHPVDGQI